LLFRASPPPPSACAMAPIDKISANGTRHGGQHGLHLDAQDAYVSTGGSAYASSITTRGMGIAPSHSISSPVVARAAREGPTPGEPPELVRDSKSWRGERPRRARTGALRSRGRVSREARARAHTLPPPM